MGTSYADNVALVQEGFWFTWRDGAVNGGILMPIYNNGNGAYHQTIENVTFNGGNPGTIGSGAITGAPVIVDLRQNTTGYAGVWSFLNDSVEDANSDFFQVENSTENSCGTALPAGSRTSRLITSRMRTAQAKPRCTRPGTGCPAAVHPGSWC